MDSLAWFFLFELEEMTKMAVNKSLLSLAALPMLVAGSAHAATIASTDFNDSVFVGGNIKSNLNWTLNGLDDPGDMAALNEFALGQPLFDGNAFVQDIFIPGLNTGNGNTFWTTDVSLTVATGFSVTLTDVTFNSVSVNGSQAENVNRQNDYTLTLIDPSSNIVEEITIADTLAGTVAGQPLVTFDFVDVALTVPGTYTLRIKGGDFTGANETGNHTGIDNLSINGIVTPEPGSIALLGLGGLMIVRRRR